MQNDLCWRGPFAEDIVAMPLLDGESGCISEAGSSVDHVHWLDSGSVCGAFESAHTFSREGGLSRFTGR